MRFTWTTRLGVGAVVMVLLAQTGRTEQRPADRRGADWPMYRHDLAGTGYSPLTEIDASNVARLAQSWTYSLQSDAPAATSGRGGAPIGPNSEATPIVIDGVLYVPAANRVVALDAASGKVVWNYPTSGGAPSRRGVAYWPGESGAPARIIFTAGRRLIALNAKSGAVERGFGKDGEVDMVVPYNSVPLVYKNIVVVGASTPAGTSGG